MADSSRPLVYSRDIDHACPLLQEKWPLVAAEYHEMFPDRSVRPPDGGLNQDPPNPPRFPWGFTACLVGHVAVSRTNSAEYVHVPGTTVRYRISPMR